MGDVALLDFRPPSVVNGRLLDGRSIISLRPGLFLLMMGIFKNIYACRYHLLVLRQVANREAQCARKHKADFFESFFHFGPVEKRLWRISDCGVKNCFIFRSQSTVLGLVSFVPTRLAWQTTKTATMSTSRLRLVTQQLLRRRSQLSAGSSLVHSTLRAFSSSAQMDLLKQLRSQSGAPIVDCKKALKESSGGLTDAMDWLRQHGAAKASSKVQGRETAQGLVGLQMSKDKSAASLVKVASETDFSGRSQRFVDLVLALADAALQDPHCQANNEDSRDSFLATPASATGKSVKDLLDEAIVAIQENLSVAAVHKFQVDDDGSILVGYVHNKVDAADAGTAAAVVQVAPADGTGTSKDVLQTVGKRLAMHIVAARPSYLSPEDVPSDEVEKERQILSMQVESSGKPLEIVEKIVAGRLRKFYEEICLTEQAHMIEESNPKVSKVLEENGVVVKRFECLRIG